MQNFIMILLLSFASTVCVAQAPVEPQEIAKFKKKLFEKCQT
jgi:hypothetical protein